MESNQTEKGFCEWWEANGAIANSAEECGAYQAWCYRQIEIDALKEELQKLREELRRCYQPMKLEDCAYGLLWSRQP